MSLSVFESGIVFECTSGMIIARSHNRTFGGPNVAFISQLIIHLPLLNITNNTLEGKIVECTHSSEVVNIIGNYTIAYTRLSNGRSSYVLYKE